MTERDVALMVAAGTLPSPTEFMGSTFLAIRVSGTGVAYRPSIDEFVYRPPDVWLSPIMAARAAGVPVIAEHPEKSALDGDEFYSRIVGMTLMGFVRQDELWAIARIIDQRASAIIKAGQFDTSPAVLFGSAAENSTIELDGGDKLLVEGDPSLLDHVALIDMTGGNAGVWSKGGTEEPGVSVPQPEKD